MNESTEVLQEIEVQVEEIPADASSDDVLSESEYNTDSYFVPDTKVDVDIVDLLTVDDTESVVDESTEVVPVESTELVDESVDDIVTELDSAEAIVTVDTTTIAESLQQIHFDLIVIIFLLVFYWVNERFKIGIRNFQKWTR